jgi:hypothetical protein
MTSASVPAERYRSLGLLATASCANRYMHDWFLVKKKEGHVTRENIMMKIEGGNGKQDITKYKCYEHNGWKRKEAIRMKNWTNGRNVEVERRKECFNYYENEVPDQWKESIIVPVHKKVIKLTVTIIVGYHCYQLHTKFYQISSSQS